MPRVNITGPLVLFLLTVAFYWKLLLTGQFTWLDSPDMANMVLPRFQFMASEWRHMRFPLWDPYQWNGQPFLGEWTGAAMPLNWPLFIFGGFQEGKIRLDWMNWYFAIIHWLGAVFCYAMCRDLGITRGSAILAGVLFGFGGYFGNTDWPEVFTGCVWIPLVFLYLFRAARGQRPVASAAMSGLFCGMSWLAGHHQAPFYLTVSVMFTWLGLAVARRDPWRLRHGAITLGIAALVGGLQLIPGQEYGKLALRWAGAPKPLRWSDTIPFQVHVDFSTQPQDLFGIVLPHMSGHVPLMAGVIALIGIAAALRARWPESAVRILAGVAVGGLLFSLAEFNLFHGVLYALFPGYEKSRVPARMAMMWSFAIAPLAAYGFDWLRMNARGEWVRWLLRAAAAMFGGAFVLLVAGKAEYLSRLECAGIYLLAAAGLFAMGGRWMVPGLVAFTMIEHYQQRILIPYPDPKGMLAKLWEHQDVAAFLRQQPGPFRVDVSEEIQYNFGEWHQINAFGGFGAGVTENIVEMDWPGEPTHRMLGIAYSIGKKPARDGQQEVFSSPKGWKVYRNPETFPLAWMVHEVRQASAEIEKMRGAVTGPGVDLRKTAFVDSPPPALAACDGDEPVTWKERRAARIRFEVEARCKGLVVVSDTWYPGWSATVDGKSAPILQVNGALRGVVIEGGKHSVEMKFRGSAFYTGLLMTIVGIAAALWLQFTRAGGDKVRIL